MAYLLQREGTYRAAGVSTYARNLSEALSGVVPDLHVDVYHGSDAPVLRGVTSHAAPFPTANPIVRIGWEQVGFPAITRNQRFDVVHGTVNVVPKFGRSARVVTIHDLAFLRYPERFRRSRVLYLSAIVRDSARLAQRIICVSESTRQDVISLLAVKSEKVHVVRPGIPAAFHPLPEARVAEFSDGLFDGAPFILHVGTLEPRKNIDVLIRAFARLRARRQMPHVLALAGGRGWMFEPLFELVTQLGLETSVRFVDFVASEQLPLWYNAATVVAVPSVYEGFGFPVAEAMSCGAPVITSNTSSLAEIAGDASVSVAPGSVEELELALEQVLDDDQLRVRLRSAGLERASTFTWDRSATATAAVYRAAAGDAR